MLSITAGDVSPQSRPTRNALSAIGRVNRRTNSFHSSVPASTAQRRARSSDEMSFITTRMASDYIKNLHAEHDFRIPPQPALRVKGSCKRLLKSYIPDWAIVVQFFGRTPIHGSISFVIPPGI